MSLPYHIEKLPDEPIIISHLAADYSVARDMPSSDAATLAILEKTTVPLFLIVDTSEIALQFDDLLVAASRGSRGEKPIWHHPMIRQAVCVTRSGLIKLAVKGLNSPSFGRLNAKVFDSLEAALAYCRAEVETHEGVVSK